MLIAGAAPVGDALAAQKGDVALHNPPQWPVRHGPRRVNSRYGWPLRWLSRMLALKCSKVGRAVPCPPPPANERVLIHHDGAHGVTRPTSARRNPHDNIPRPPVFADGHRCRRPGGQSGTDPVALRKWWPSARSENQFLIPPKD